jgi:ParB family transcriptional regulator, chromosome partitioning protein
MGKDRKVDVLHHVAGEQEIRSIPIDSVRIVNPRVRSQKVFAGIVESIATVGLKRPITVAEARSEGEEQRYDLICGQGRLEAFRALGETEIPALIVRASETDLYLMSLVENLARRKHSNRDLLAAVRALEDRGYGPVDIARKTGLDPGYISGIVQLLKAGEERLIGAVEKGWLPITLASQIARAGDAEVQIAMMEAYETGLLRGEQFLKVRRLIDCRQALGKGYGVWRRKRDQPLTASKLAKTFQAEVRRQQLLVRKSEVAEQRLLFVVTALRRMLADEHFRTLLRAESIGDIPKPLADRIEGKALA